MIETQRLLLRQFTQEDLKAYHQVLKQKAVYKWLGKGTKITKEHVSRIINHDQTHWHRHQLGTWAVVLKASSQLIGHCGFTMVKDLNQYELLYAFSPSFWGKGYATEACLVSIKWLHYHTDIDTIIALSYLNNQPSIHIIEKLGFQFIKEYPYIM